MRSCCCVGYLTNPGGRCCMDLQDEQRGQATVVTDRITITPTAPNDPFKPQDDPQTPAPSPLAGSWQCSGCGRIYNMFVNSCDCQMHRFRTSGNTTAGATMPKNVYGTLTSEMG